MKSEERLTGTISIDTKKSRLRIHKTLLHQLGDPQYIQFLVDPTKMAVAVRCVDAPLFGDCVHTIGRERAGPAFSCEIYSRHFMSKLSSLVPSMGRDCLYRMSGKIIPSQKMAVFDLKTIMRLES